MELDLTGQIVVVIGGTRGIGWAICEVLHRQGAKVITCGSSESSVEQARKKAATLAPGLEVFQADARSEADMRTLIEHACAGEGCFTSVIYCAGKSLRGDVTQTSLADWDLCLDLNLRAPFLAAHLAIPCLKGVPNANLVFVSSIWAVTATRRRVAYSVAKAGLAALARNLAIDHGPDGIRVNAIAPGYIGTNLLERSIREVSPHLDLMPTILGKHPLGRIGAPHDVAQLVGFLASPAAAFITGQLLVIDGGATAQFALADLWK
jgi:meso-butanediol dehydrogenase/(S,S)-butanediol dehydrogenase/diacetyl reductase